MNTHPFLAICLNPTLQKTLRLAALELDAVNRTAEHRLDACGKGINVTRVLTQLGRQVVHLTQLGGSLCPLFLDLCAQDGLEVRWTDSGSAIRFCYTLIDAATRFVTELVEESEPVGLHTEGALRDLYGRVLPDRGTLIFSGTKAAGFSDQLVPDMVRAAKERGLTVILDVKGADLKNSLPYGPDIIKPNLSEFVATYLPDPPGSERELRDAVADKALALCRRHRCRVVVTRGARSVWAADGDDFFEMDFEVVPPVNTTGSGDAFTAGLAAALSEGADLRSAIAEGARCGRLNAGLFKPGVIR